MNKKENISITQQPDLILKGTALRSIPKQIIRGEALVSQAPVTFLGFVDAKTGQIVQEDHELNGKSITDKIFVFPRGIGSTVAPYVLINLARNKKAPRAMINRESDQGTVSGSSIARIPLVYNFDKDPTVVIHTGDYIEIEINNAQALVKVYKKNK